MSLLRVPHGSVPSVLACHFVYFSANAYLIEALPAALAAKTVVRSAAGAVMPLFITQMFHGLGNGGAAKLLGGVAIIMAMIPLASAKWG
ncbi:hypothetical protein JCM24511_08116 [Saitozyma sp. JCM 24511]|nr:hypothetical protein JCM24511_08116 [Saitozyma sp. JCM 24511]